MSARWQYNKAEPTPGRECKDCKGTARHYRAPRPAPYPGPRCATHHNEEKRRRRLASANRRVERQFGISPEQYEALYEFQGGRCAICRRATGASKRLAVDHDHRLAMTHGHPHDQGCPECVRGLVCSTCNDVLAHFRDDRDTAERLVRYLNMSPMRRMAFDQIPWHVQEPGRV